MCIIRCIWSRAFFIICIYNTVIGIPTIKLRPSDLYNGNAYPWKYGLYADSDPWIISMITIHKFLHNTHWNDLNEILLTMNSRMWWLGAVKYPTGGDDDCVFHLLLLSVQTRELIAKPSVYPLFKSRLCVQTGQTFGHAFAKAVCRHNADWKFGYVFFLSPVVFNGISLKPINRLS